MNRHTAVSRFAIAMYDTEWDRVPIDRRSSIPEERKQAVLARWMQEGDARADEILDKGLPLWLSHLNGRYSVHNQKSRRLFTDLTGIKLPGTNKQTDSLLREYVGEAIIKAWEDECAAKKAAEEEAERARKAEEKRVRIENIQKSLVADKEIGGEEVLEYARHIGIDVHPRTAGTLISRVSSIKDGQAAITRQRSGRLANLPQQVWTIFKAVRSHALASVQSEVTVESN